jgi:hypothetical protein
MRRFPTEFAELLSPKGRRILEGRDALCGGLRVGRDPFLAISGVIGAREARSCQRLLEATLGGTLLRMEDPIPEGALSSMTEDYTEVLPKTVRVSTALLGSRRSRAWIAAQRAGLVGMLRSETFRAFASQLAGRPLRRGWGIQVLRYGPGDYAGPHNDHHPEEPAARGGYLDVHFSFSADAVAHQWLVYERAGHLSEITSVATLGGLTAYRLPFWHYTTPLVARRGREADARRWVMLGTFLFA